MGTSIALLRALITAGTGSRRRLADAVRQGRVEVNGKLVEDLLYPLNIETDRVSINGQPVNLKPEKAVYLMLNKPKGVLSTTSDERGRRTVVGVLPRKYRRLRLYPVGRLDKDSTGLMLLTNDGELTYRLTHPRFEYEKEYLVSTEKRLGPDKKRKLEQGLELEDGITRPVIVREVHVSPFNYSITIHEGRKRQVRRMFAHLGCRALSLKRIRLGNLSLGDLKEGEMRELNIQEVEALGISPVQQARVT